ncbi:MAG: hypothetical protein WA996_22505 [Candidatus Promineifilaceae bacterium]
MGTKVMIFMLGTLTVLLILLGVYGRTMDTKMLIFTPIISVASGIFLLALYRSVANKLQGIWQQWRDTYTWSRDDLNTKALIRAFVIEVVFQRKLYRDDRLRWARHIFIYWGFVGLWIFDGIFFFFTKILNLQPRHPFHLFLDFGLDLYGGVLLLGLSVALIRAYFVRGSKGSIYNDTPAVSLLFVVTATGFFLEALRLVSVPYEPYMSWSFLGLALASALGSLNWPWASVYEVTWIFHAVIASVSIAYIPLSRMVHIFAVPLGRLLESQQEMLAVKIQSIGRGLMGK